MKKLPEERSAEASKIILILASLVVVITGMKLAADFIIPILLAFFIATISFPITNWLREHKVPRFIAVLMTVLVDFAFLAGVVILGIVLTTELKAKWDSKYYQLFNERIDSASEWMQDMSDKFGLNEEKEEEPEKPEEKKDGVPVGGDANGPVNNGNGGTNGPVVGPVQPEDGADDNPEAGAVAGDGKGDANAPPATPELAKEEEAQSGIDLLKDQILQRVSPDNILDWVQGFLKSMLSLLGTTFVVMLLTVFMLSEARMFGRRFQAICEAKGPNLQRMLSATRDIQKYLGIKTLISLATGLLAGLLCWKMGLEFPLLWGILAFALNFIPAVGSVIAGIPPILLSLLNDGDLQHASIIGIGYIVINGFLGNFLEPTLLGRRFGISTVVVILSVIFWGWIWGPVGMLMAVPLTMLLKVGLDNSSDFRWIAVAISKESKKNTGQEEQMIKEGAEPKAKVIAD